MPITANTIVTGTTPVLVASGRGPADTVRVIAKTASTNHAYFGGPDVTTAQGLPLLTTDTTPITFELGPGDQLWVVAPAAGSVQVLRTRQ